MSQDDPKQPAASKVASSQSSLPSAAVGQVERSDREIIVVSLRKPDLLNYRDFIEVRFEKKGKSHFLIAQVELLVGEGVKIGTKTIASAGVKFFGLKADFERTEDLKESKVQVTAKIIAFIDNTGYVQTHYPTVEYVGEPVFLADVDNLSKIFSHLDDGDISQLEVGTVLGSSKKVLAVLDPVGFMRHTAVFGQSGSGKSFSFGIILEELIQKTNARILVLDPNSDYRRFATLRSATKIRSQSKREYTLEAHEELTKLWKDLASQFYYFSENDGSLVLSFSDLRRQDQADILGIDPVLDRDEFSVFRETIDELKTYTIYDILDRFQRPSSVEKLKLSARIKNRDVDKLSLWGKAGAVKTSIADLLKTKPWKFVSLDLRNLRSIERSIASAAVLESVYRDVVQKRQITFFVVEEAHNFCPAVPWDSHQEAPRQILHEIAAEGRKYGAFLMLLTQNPSKLSQQALLQCDNVILMKMTSGVEVRALDTVVKDAGPRLAQMAFSLTKGEAICMGSIVRNEASIKFDLRKTEAGGDDVGKEWARRKI